MPPAGPPLPLKTRLLTAAINGLTDAALRPDGTVNRRLLGFFDRTAPPNPTPTAGVATSDHLVDPARDLWVRLFSPSPDSPLPVIVYFHGGGFALHSAASRAYDALCRRLASQTPARVVSVEYRLAPEHRHPAAYHDCFDVLRWLTKGEGRRLIADSASVFLAGDSAGGSIGHHVARRAAAESVDVAGLVGIQPFFGGEKRTESEEMLEGTAPFARRERYERFWSLFLPVGSNRDHEAANVFGPGSVTPTDPGEWAGFPATMVCVGGYDVMQDRQRMYAEGLSRAGVEVRVAEYPNGFHGFFAFPELPEAQRVIKDIGDFVRQRSEK